MYLRPQILAKLNKVTAMQKFNSRDKATNKQKAGLIYLNKSNVLESNQGIQL